MLAMSEKKITNDPAFKLGSGSRDNKISSTEDFTLDNAPENPQEFHLESLVPLPHETENQEVMDHAQVELFLPDSNPESPTDNEQQLEFNGLAKPVYAMKVEGHHKPLQFHYANNLLESLESQGVQVHYECRDGYCGACRTDLIDGEVAYLQEPMAWINKGEILPCCCVPKTPLTLKLKGYKP